MPEKVLVRDLNFFYGDNRALKSINMPLYARQVTGLAIWDLTGGFKCFRRTVLEAIDLSAVRSNGYAFQIEMTS